MSNNNSALGAKLAAMVVTTSEIVSAEIRDGRGDSIALFSALDDPQQEQIALDAWLIGLRALAHAHAQAQEARLQDVGRDLLQDLDGRLQAHVQHQHETIAGILGRFFDPRDGHVSQRLDAFVADHGVLARLLEKFIGPQNSVLAESLARQVGETSPLFKRLSPTDSQGLVKTLEHGLARVMGEGHATLERALDPLAEGGAVARFLASLREQLDSADEDRSKQLATALAALDANDPNSLICKLVKETEQGRQDVLRAVNPNLPGSPMAAISDGLERLLAKHAESQNLMLRRQAERQERLEKDVREALVRLETRKQLELKSPRGGLLFEETVVRFLVEATAGAPCVVDSTGRTPGDRSTSKKGDAVVRFTNESAFAGAAMVLEAKREAGYSVHSALAELDEARKNRDASAGVFVMAASHAAPTFPSFVRYGNNVLVTWDDTDSRTDPRLHAAVCLGLALVTRSKPAGDAGTLDAVRDIEQRIEDEVERLTKMEKHNESIRRNSEELGEDIRKAGKKLNVLLRNARETLKALKIEVVDEDSERATPIALPSGSLDRAVAALPPLAAHDTVPEDDEGADGPSGEDLLDADAAF